MMKYAGKTFAVLTLICVIFFAAGSAAEVAKKVAVLPFQINAAEDYSYLRDGILDMLASRLAWEDKVEVIEKQAVNEALAGHEGPLNEPFAREVGHTLGADYVLFGSLTIFGDSVSIDAKMVPLDTDAQPVTVYAQTKGMDEVIPRINDFAQEVNSKIFGRQPTVVAVAPSQPRFSQAHPETMLYSTTAPAGPVPPGTIPGQPQQQTSQLNPYFVVPSSVYSGGIWQSQQLEVAITSMAVADVNNDSIKEIILISPGELHIYQQAAARLQLIRTHKGNSLDHFLWVTAADLNGNGTVEIYVSNRRREEVMGSFVLEWNGTDWVEIAGGIPYHLRAANLPGQGEVLLGQSSQQDEPFWGGVSILNKEGTGYKPISGVPIPKGANIYSFTMADITQNGSIESLIVDKSGAFLVKDSTGDMLWQSDDRFAASFDFMQGVQFDPTLRSAVDTNVTALQSRSSTANVREKVFLNAPILVADLNRDERPEVIVNKNISGLLGRKFLDINFFGKSELYSMSWNGMSMATDWHTPAFQGMTTAYELADMNGDGGPELLVALVNSPGTAIWQKAKSKVVVYPIAAPQAGQEESKPQ